MVTYGGNKTSYGYNRRKKEKVLIYSPKPTMKVKPKGAPNERYEPMETDKVKREEQMQRNTEEFQRMLYKKEGAEEERKRLLKGEGAMEVRRELGLEEPLAEQEQPQEQMQSVQSTNQEVQKPEQVPIEEPKLKAESLNVQTATPQNPLNLTPENLDFITGIIESEYDYRKETEDLTNVDYEKTSIIDLITGKAALDDWQEVADAKTTSEKIGKSILAIISTSTFAASIVATGALGAAAKGGAVATTATATTRAGPTISAAANLGKYKGSRILYYLAAKGAGWRSISASIRGGFIPRRSDLIQAGIKMANKTFKKTLTLRNAKIAGAVALGTGSLIGGAYATFRSLGALAVSDMKDLSRFVEEGQMSYTEAVSEFDKDIVSFNTAKRRAEYLSNLPIIDIFAKGLSSMTWFNIENRNINKIYRRELDEAKLKNQVSLTRQKYGE